MLLKFTCFRLGISRFGIGPVRALFWRFNPVRNVKFWIEFGMLPVNKLDDRSRKMSWGEKFEGMFPEKLFS